MADNQNSIGGDDDEFADIPEGTELRPTKLTPEIRREIEEAEKRMKRRREHSG